MNDTHIGRRRFMQYPAAGIVLAASAEAQQEEQAAAKRSGEILHVEETSKVDVLVVGGGTAGTIAAIQAARAGAKTLLVERSSMLGGTMTKGGVAFPGLFDAWGKQIIAGIGWELVKESVELDGGTLPDFSKVPQRHWMNQVKVNQYLYPLLAEEKCEQADVQIAYYEFPQTVTRTADGWQVDCAGFGTRRRVLCKQIIDCTGGAEVVGMLGLPRLREDETQPGSILFRLGKPYEAGREQVIQASYIHGADSTNSRTVTAANLKGRKDLLAKVRSAKGKGRLMHMQPEASFRESYRIEGETVITVDDYTSGRMFEDSICNAFYPVDLHTKTGVRPKKLKPGTVPTVPLSALVPKGSSNILVAGRCVSSDRLANSGLRVQASCMAMGQAAGAAAALAVQQQRTPLAVPLSDIRALLTQHDAILAGDSIAPARQGAQESSESGEETTDPVVQGASMLVGVSSAVVVGSWLEGTIAKSTIGSSYLHDNNEEKGKKSITFTVKVDEPAHYAIRFHYNTHPTRSSCTPVTVEIGEKVQTFSVNQRQSDGKGLVLGTFDIQDQATVTVSNTGTDGHVIVDGLEFIKK